MLLLLRRYQVGRLAGLVALASCLYAPLARAEPLPQPTTARTPAAPSLVERVGPWLVGVGGVAVLAGVGTGFAAKAREDDARSQCRHGTGGRAECPESTRADFDAARGFASATNVLLIGGGLLSIAGLGFLIVAADAHGPASGAKVELTPALGLDGPSLALTGAF